MIYESSLKHIRAKRSAKKQGDTSVTALEVYRVLLNAIKWKACHRSRRTL